MAKLIDVRPSLLLALEAFTLVIGSVFFLYSIVEPRWETNDDIAMSMVVHGYGIASEASANLVFSNVMWGYLTSYFPAMDGVSGYSAASLFVLVLAASVIYFGLVKQGAGRAVALAVYFLIFVRPFVFPQFTLNSGLLFISAFVALCLFVWERHLVYLAVAGLLATLSYLVRSQEFLLIALVAVPMLPWRALCTGRPAMIAVLMFAAILVSATVLDTVSYKTESWTFYNELNPVRAIFTDFNAGEVVKSHLNTLAKYRYSQNDVELLQNWFFVDKSVADPVALKRILADIGTLDLRRAALQEGSDGFKTLFGTRLLPLIVATAFAAALCWDWRAMSSLLLVMALSFAISAMGRSGTLRIYEPLLALVLVAPFARRRLHLFPKLPILLMLLTAGTMNFVEVTKTSLGQQEWVDARRAEISSLPDAPVVVWGVGLPLEAIYPVLDRINYKKTVALYPLGAFTWAPFSVAYAQQKSGQGMTQRLRTDEGVWIAANGPNFTSLNIYCQEHFGTKLEEIEKLKMGEVLVSRRRCIK